MKRYKIIFTPDAVHDIENLYQYNADVLASPINAVRQRERIMAKIMKLEYMPKRHSILSDLEPLSELRRLLVDNFSVLYQVQDDTVIVTKVVYSRQIASRA